MKSNKGFTLIELLIVIGIIAILALITLVAVNPARLFGQSRDAVRESHLNAITSAVAQYRAEHEGNLPDTDGDPATDNFPTDWACIGAALPCFDLAIAGVAGATIVPDYIAELPLDPQDGTDNDTGYSIMINTNGRIEASATGEVRTDLRIIR
jgi:prepilin-type N-terminal cleavage/methylation domain-containing protein